MHGALQFIATLYRNSRDDGLLRHSAAVAYYAIFSLPAFLLVVFSVARTVLQNTSVDEEILRPVRLYMGDETARLLQQAAAGVQEASLDPQWPISIGVILLLAAAIGLVRELQASLNEILDLKPAPASFWRIIVRYISTLVPVILIGIIFTVSITLSGLISIIERRVGTVVDLPFDLLQIGNYLVVLLSLTAVFSVLYTVLPARRYAPKRILLCAFGGALLLLLGSMIVHAVTLLSSMGAMYGVAAGLIVLLFWLFFSANVFFVGAECLDLMARMAGKRTD